MSYLNSPRGSPPKAGGGCHPGSTPSPPRLVGVGQSPASVHGLDLASLSPAQSPLRGVDHRQKEHFLKPEENPTQIALDSNPKRGVQSFPTFPLLFFIVWRKVFFEFPVISKSSRIYITGINKDNPKSRKSWSLPRCTTRRPIIAQISIPDPREGRARVCQETRRTAAI